MEERIKLTYAQFMWLLMTNKECTCTKLTEFILGHPDRETINDFICESCQKLINEYD